MLLVGGNKPRPSRQILGQTPRLGPSDSQIEKWQSVFNRKNLTEQSLVQQQQAAVEVHCCDALIYEYYRTDRCVGRRQRQR